MLSTKMLENSVLVVAHQDDEVLWFSSILDKVDEILIAFLECRFLSPLVTLGRRRSLSQYPIKNTSCLGIPESGVFSDRNFRKPVVNKYGLEINKNSLAQQNYVANYYTLKTLLQKRMKNYKNIITHNPWGEYGNEEHIQVYRVLKSLQAEMKFNLWFPNYCSNKSFKLMLQFIIGKNYQYTERMKNNDASHFLKLLPDKVRQFAGFSSRYVTLEINLKLAAYIANLYKENGCWTWYNNWHWFKKESFINDDTGNNYVKKRIYIFPWNLINIEFPFESKSKAKLLRLLTRKTNIYRW
jgi:hypothetical protein